MSSLQASVINGRFSRHAMCSMKRVLPQPVGPLSIIGRPRANAAANSATSLPAAR